MMFTCKIWLSLAARVSSIWAELLCASSPHRAPENAPLKSKMIYASSKDAIKKKFTGDWPLQFVGSLELLYKTPINKGD